MAQITRIIIAKRRERRKETIVIPIPIPTTITNNGRGLLRRARIDNDWPNEKAGLVGAGPAVESGLN